MPVAKRFQPRGFFWYGVKHKEFCVVVLDPTRRERDPKDRRRKKVWCKEFRSDTLHGLLRKARAEGVVLPKNTKELCEQSTIVE